MYGMDVAGAPKWSTWAPEPQEETPRVDAVVKEDEKPASPQLAQPDFELAGRLSAVGSGSIDQLAGVPQLERKPLSAGLHGLAAANPYEGMLGALRTAAMRRDAAAVVAESTVAATSAPAAAVVSSMRLVGKDWRDSTPSNGWADPAAPPPPDPEPTPVPDPDPIPEPTPDPDPVPTPDPEPVPDPEPTPDPEPAPDPPPDPPPPPSDPIGTIIGGLLGGLFGHH